MRSWARQCVRILEDGACVTAWPGLPGSLFAGAACVPNQPVSGVVMASCHRKDLGRASATAPAPAPAPPLLLLEVHVRGCWQPDPRSRGLVIFVPTPSCCVTKRFAKAILLLVIRSPTTGPVVFDSRQRRVSGLGDIHRFAFGGGGRIIGSGRTSVTPIPSTVAGSRSSRHLEGRAATRAHQSTDG